MKDNLINELTKVNSDLIIPGYIIKNYDKLDLEGYEFLLLIYLVNQKDHIPFDINKISTDLNIDNNKAFEIVNNLNEKNYISIDMKKNNGVIEEFITTDLFFNKISSILMDTKVDEENSDIYSVFESEFGRVLSPIETETIRRWIESDIDEELIKEALKEAILSGVRNISYIDKIIANWIKKGYKNTDDVKRKKVKKEEEMEEILIPDWLNE